MNGAWRVWDQKRKPESDVHKNDNCNIYSGLCRFVIFRNSYSSKNVLAQVWMWTNEWASFSLPYSDFSPRVSDALISVCVCVFFPPSLSCSFISISTVSPYFSDLKRQTPKFFMLMHTWNVLLVQLCWLCQNLVMKIPLSIVNSQHVGSKMMSEKRTGKQNSRHSHTHKNGLVNAKGDEMSPCFRNYIRTTKYDSENWIIKKQNTHTHQHIYGHTYTIRAMETYAYSM